MNSTSSCSALRSPIHVKCTNIEFPASPLCPRLNLLYPLQIQPNAFNDKLSLDRANEVKSHLVDKGVDANRLSTVGYGEDKPKESNKTRKGRIANRRVEFKVVE